MKLGAIPHRSRALSSFILKLSAFQKNIVVGDRTTTSCDGRHLAEGLVRFPRLLVYHFLFVPMTAFIQPDPTRGAAGWPEAPVIRPEPLRWRLRSWQIVW